MRKVSWVIVLVGISIWLGNRFSSVEKNAARELASSDPYSTATKSQAEPAKLADARTALLSEIQRINHCYEPEVCDFPQTDPKSYSFAVGKRIVTLLKEFSTQYGSTSPDVLVRLARQFVHSEDGFVQEVALNIFHALPPTQENLVAITEGIENSTNPLIVDQAMREMQRYLGGDGEQVVHNALGKIMATGPHFSSQTVATGILPFINDSSYPEYQRTARALNKDTTTAQRLRSALDEYHRLKTGS